MKRSGEQTIMDIIIGENGRFASAFKNSLGTNAVNISNIKERKNLEFIKGILSMSQKTNSKIKIYWCLGKSKSRSEKYMCDDDFTTLSNFLIEIEHLGAKNIEVIYLSSGGTVYGNNAGYVNENSVLNPQSYYAEMKIKSEILLNNLNKKSGMRISLFRIANAYSTPKIGSSMGIVESLIDCIENQKEFNLKVSLKSEKQYGTYSNYSSSILQYLQEFRNRPNTFQIQNIFSDQIHTLKSLIALLESYFESTLNISGLKDLPEESVILESIYKPINQNSWISVQEFLTKCYPKS